MKKNSFFIANKNNHVNIYIVKNNQFNNARLKDYF